MSAKRISPEQRALRNKIGELMDGAGIKSLGDIQEFYKEMIGQFLEKGL
jgi:hypothetical protein